MCTSGDPKIEGNFLRYCPSLSFISRDGLAFKSLFLFFCSLRIFGHEGASSAEGGGVGGSDQGTAGQDQGRGRDRQSRSSKPRRVDEEEDEEEDFDDAFDGGGDEDHEKMASAVRSEAYAGIEQKLKVRKTLLFVVHVLHVSSTYSAYRPPPGAHDMNI